MSSNLAEKPREDNESLADQLVEALETAIRSAPNSQLLNRRLSILEDTDHLVCFLHRFLHFNDALAARVPYLAGLIHLNPDLFADPSDVEAFCRQRNASISAHIAAAAADEYRIAPGRNMVHQRLSQVFFRGVLDYYGADGGRFDRKHPLPSSLDDLLREARTKFFDERGAAPAFAAIGFHVGLEFFANEEFNLVDDFLKSRHPDLVATLKRSDDADTAPYVWLSLHTVVEIGHYRAGLEAVRDAVRFCSPREAAPAMARQILVGLEAFADLQRRFYRAALPDAGGLD